MSDLIGEQKNNKKEQEKFKNLREKYRQDINDNRYKNLHKVPPHLQQHAKRFIDGKSKGLGTTRNSHSISVKYPPEMYDTLCSLEKRSDYIRRAVLAQLHKDNLITSYDLPEP